MPTTSTSLLYLQEATAVVVHHNALLVMMIMIMIDGNDGKIHPSASNVPGSSESEARNNCNYMTTKNRRIRRQNECSGCCGVNTSWSPNNVNVVNDCDGDEEEEEEEARYDRHYIHPSCTSWVDGWMMDGRS